MAGRTGVGDRALVMERQQASQVEIGQHVAVDYHEGTVPQGARQPPRRARGAQQALLERVGDVQPAIGAISEGTGDGVRAVVQVDGNVADAVARQPVERVGQHRPAVHPEGFLVGEEAGAAIAYACCERWTADRSPALDEDPALTHDPVGRICCITGMAVRHAFRGRGFGMALLDRLIEQANGWSCEKIVLETTHAVGFYQPSVSCFANAY